MRAPLTRVYDKPSSAHASAWASSAEIFTAAPETVSALMRGELQHERRSTHTPATIPHSAIAYLQRQLWPFRENAPVRPVRGSWAFISAATQSRPSLGQGAAFRINRRHAFFDV